MKFNIEAYNMKLSIDWNAKMISVETKKSKLTMEHGVVNAELKKQIVDKRIVERVKKRIAETHVNN